MELLGMKDLAKVAQLGGRDRSRDKDFVTSSDLDLNCALHLQA